MEVQSVHPDVSEHPDLDSGYHKRVIHQRKYPQRVSSSEVVLVVNHQRLGHLLSLIELGSHLRIEESLRAYDNDKPKGNNVAGPSVFNMVEHNNSSRYNDNKGKRKHHDTRANPNKKPKLTCWKCRKPGHLKKDCKAGQNMFNKSQQIYYVTYVSKAFFVRDDDVAWWADSGATVHVYKDRCWFKTYESLNDGSILHMENESTTLVHGRSCVDLRLNIISDNIGSAFMSTSKLNDSILRHARLGYVHFKRMQDMSKDGLIPAFDMDTGKSGDKKYFVTFIDHASRAVVRLPDPKLKTLGERGIECIFVGYAEHSKAFRFYVIEPNDSVAINSIIESRNAIFDENMFSSVPSPSHRSLVKRTEDCGGSVVPEKTSDDIVQQSEPQLRKSKRHRTPKDFGPEFQLYLIEGTRDEKEAINDEMDFIMGNNTWVLTDLPPGCRPLGCKWIFKRNLKVDGTVEKFKARLVIQDFKQKSGIDYFDTYAHVARINTIRLLIAMTSIHSLIIHQMDVKTAFLNGELEEGVYMNQPLGFIFPGNKNKVCKLVKSFYELKQAPKQWHQKFDEVVLSNGYLFNQTDKCVYSSFDASGKGVIICLYVNDMLIFGTDQVQVDLTKEFLSSRFSMKDIGEAYVILGIRIKHESNCLAISQSHYIEKFLKKFNYSNCTPVSTPLDTCEKLMPNRGLAVSQLEYSRVIGCLMYAMTCIRPDIAFDVGKLSRDTINPGTPHSQAIHRVLKYLKKTTDYRLIYFAYPSVLEGYIEASWINNTEDNSSTSGWIPLWVKPMAPISIRCDSATTLAKAYSQMYNGKSRHLGVRHSMIRELTTNGVKSIEFMRSQQNLADHLMKSLARLGYKRAEAHVYKSSQGCAWNLLKGG
ncbi:zinc finger, CCHC-type containing protein [Tanacetum coccineum]